MPHYGHSLFLERGDYQNARIAFEQALAIAEDEGDEAMEMQALSLYGSANFFSLKISESLMQSRKAIELSERVHDIRSGFYAHQTATLSTWFGGDASGMERHSRSYLEFAEKHHDRYVLTASLFARQAAEMCKGNWTLARRYNQRALGLNPNSTQHLCDFAILEYESGNAAQGDALLERLLDAMRSQSGGVVDRVHFAVSMPQIALSSGNPDHLAIAYDTGMYTDSIMSRFPTNLFSVIAKAGLALTAVLRNDIDSARYLYNFLIDYHSSFRMIVLICTEHLLGMLSKVAGEVPTALSHFETALTFCRESGFAPKLAWTCYDYAETLSRTDSGELSSTTRQQMAALLDEGLITAQRLAMQPLCQRILELQEQMGPGTIRNGSHPNGLTRRENQVLSLMAQGRSNAEIAEELFISLNTVTRHVSHIFARTGTSNRAEAAVFAVRHDLV